MYKLDYKAIEHRVLRPMFRDVISNLTKATDYGHETLGLEFEDYEGLRVSDLNVLKTYEDHAIILARISEGGPLLAHYLTDNEEIIEHLAEIPLADPIYIITKDGDFYGKASLPEQVIPILETYFGV